MTQNLHTAVSLSTRIRRKITWLRVPIATLIAFTLIALMRYPSAFWVGSAIALFGEGLQIWAASHLHKDKKFTVSGPYAHVRNPMYVGRFFVLLGLFVMPANALLIGIYVAAFAAYAQSRVGREEKRLQRIFAPHYDHYRGEVHRWLPRLRPYSRAENRRASWLQVCFNGEQLNALGLLVVLMVLGARLGLLLPELLHFPLLGKDEPRYAEVAREMFASGDYISPRLCGHLWFEKPALLYWLQAASYRVFGINEGAARLPSLLSSVATIGLLGHVVREVVSRRASWICGLVLATSVIWVGYGLAATPDMLLATTVAVAILAGYIATIEATTEKSSHFEYALGCAACAGLSMLAKGLVGPLLIGAILGLHGILTRRFVFRSGRELLAGCGVFALVIALWYVPVTLKHGQLFVDEFFVNHHFKRYLTNEFRHSQPFAFYGPIALAGALPWTAFLLPAFARLSSLRPRESARDSLLALAWIWVAVPILFFSFSNSKLAGYILPIFPALAIVLGIEAERLWNGERSRYFQATIAVTAVLMVGSGVAVALYLQRWSLAVGTFGTLLAWLPLAIALGAAGLLLLLARKATKDAWGIGIPAALTLSMIVAAALLMPAIGRSLSLKPLALQIAAKLKPGEEIAFYRKDRAYAPVFYNEGRVVLLNRGHILQGIARGDEFDAETPGDLLGVLHREQREGESGLIVITQNSEQNALQRDARFETLPVAVQGDMVALRVLLRSRSRLSMPVAEQNHKSKEHPLKLIPLL